MLCYVKNCFYFPALCLWASVSLPTSSDASLLWTICSGCLIMIFSSDLVLWPCLDYNNLNSKKKYTNILPQPPILKTTLMLRSCGILGLYLHNKLHYKEESATVSDIFTYCMSKKSCPFVYIECIIEY